MPTPDTWHQTWLGELHTVITPFIQTRKLGRLFFPVDVVLDSHNTVQPDLVFVAAKNLGIIRRRAIFGTPDLVVELLSPSSVRRDRYQKMRLYARFGVREYWIGDPANRSFEILTLKKGKYELFSSAEEKGCLRSGVLTGFEFDLARIAEHT